MTERQRTILAETCPYCATHVGRRAEGHLTACRRRATRRVLAYRVAQADHPDHVTERELRAEFGQGVDVDVDEAPAC